MSLPFWTVYHNPLDFPGKFVARLFEFQRGHSEDLRPTAEHYVADTLEEVRALIKRQANDDPAIVEVWL